MRLALFACFYSLSVCFIASALENDGAQFYVPYTQSNIVINGNLNDWKEYCYITFSDTLQELRPVPDRILMAFFDKNFDYSQTWHPLSKNTTEVWICWDLTRLYFAFQVKDQHLFAEVEPVGKVPEIHRNDGIELYIDSKADSHTKMDINDYQFIVDIAGNSIVFRGDRELMERDTTLATPKTSGQNIYYEYAVTVNDQDNQQRHDPAYLVEIAIPFAAVGLKPETGLRLKADFANNDIDYSLNGTTTYEEAALRYWAYNVSGYSDLGFPDTWVSLQLAGVPGWIEQLSASSLQRFYRLYVSLFVLSILVIAFLTYRMKRLKKLPVRSDLSPASVVFLDRSMLQTAPISENQALLQNATDYIQANSHETINSEELARHLGVSLRKLQRVTHEEINSTPTAFIYIVKLNLAAGFIKEGRGNIAETAYHFGFSSPSYFSRMFKEHFGLTPMEMKKSPGESETDNSTG
ncbi:MAG: helix-turn-helix domain-containing protein [Bacteroidales bacterium]|nr:helix-turn-helix domain-containing protein [Bacteroidales bacterium]